MEENKIQNLTEEVKEKTPKKQLSDEEKQKEKERLAKEKEKQKEKERLAKEKEKQKEKERLAKEKEKQKEKERLAKEKEKQKEKEKERLAKEKEKQKEKERLAKEKEKQKEKERLAKEKEKERLAKEKEKQKEKERLAKEANVSKTSEKKTNVLTPKNGVDAKPLVKRTINVEPKKVNLSDEIDEKELQAIKEQETKDSLSKMQAVVEARQKLDSGVGEKEKEGKIKLGKIKLDDEDKDTEQLQALKSRSNAQKQLESELMEKKDNELQMKLKEASSQFGGLKSSYDASNRSISDSKIESLMSQVEELEENNEILNEALDRAENLEYDGIKVCDPDSFEMSLEFASYLADLKEKANQKEAEPVVVETEEYKEMIYDGIKVCDSKSLEITSEFSQYIDQLKAQDMLVNDLKAEIEQLKSELEELKAPKEFVPTVEEVVEPIEVAEQKAEEVVEESVQPEKPNSEKPIKKVGRFFIDSFNGMAHGLFATLIIGVIIAQIAALFPENSIVRDVLTTISTAVKLLMGVGIGLGIAKGLKLDGIKLLCVAIAGGVCAFMQNPDGFGANADPLSIYLVVIVTYLFVKYCWFKSSPVDIIIIPLLSCLVSGVLTMLVADYVKLLTSGLGELINKATELQPIPMGIVISTVMGMCLTAPISSAAIAISIGLEGLAAGAATVGCCVQMLGFAVMSRKDNNIGKVISVGIGTSMLQFKNILRRPVIWLPTIIVSAILGPVATSVIHLTSTAVGAGMGTSGLVGIIQAFESMGYSVSSVLSIVGLCIVAPIVLVWILDIIFRKLNWIKPQDLKI